MREPQRPQPAGQQRVAGAFRATRMDPAVTVGEVWPEQWLTLFRLLSRQR